MIDLNLEFSPSEKAIVDEIGKENWLLYRKEFFTNVPNVCSGCDFIPNDGQKLNIHVLPYSNTIVLKNEFKELKSILLCDACHSVKHPDVSAKKEWIKLVNSNFNQKDLITICRHGNQAVNAHILGGHGIEKSIFLLKKDPVIYLNEVKTTLDGVFNPKIKVIFTKNFDWSNCR